SRSRGTDMKVCTFEPPLGCRACLRAKLSTFSLLFDRAILFMRPPHRRQLSVVWYRQCEGESSHTPRPICHWHTANTGLAFRSTTTQRMLILRRSNSRPRRDFFVRVSPIYSFSGAICSAFRNLQGNNAFPL